LGVELYQGDLAHKNWQMVSPPWWTYEVHADEHDICWVGTDQFLMATDGGIYNFDIPTDKWKRADNIPATQFYHVAYNPAQPQLFYGGAQDNGTTSGNKNSMNNWQRDWGGDGFRPVFNPDTKASIFLRPRTAPLPGSSAIGVLI